jgi:hypothetical protein
MVAQASIASAAAGESQSARPSIPTLTRAAVSRNAKGKPATATFGDCFGAGGSLQINIAS